MAPNIVLRTKILKFSIWNFCSNYILKGKIPWFTIIFVCFVNQTIKIRISSLNIKIKNYLVLDYFQKGQSIISENNREVYHGWPVMRVREQRHQNKKTRGINPLATRHLRKALFEPMWLTTDVHFDFKLFNISYIYN